MINNVKLTVFGEFVQTIKGAHEKNDEIIRTPELLQNIFIEFIMTQISLQEQITRSENVTSKTRRFHVNGSDLINYINVRVGTIFTELDARFIMALIVDHMNEKGGDNNLIEVDFEKNDGDFTIFMETLYEWHDTPSRFKSFHVNKFVDGLEADVVRNCDL